MTSQPIGETVVDYEKKIIGDSNLIKKEIELPSAEIPNMETCKKAEADAKANYKGKNSGAIWTAVITSILSPVVGIIPTLFLNASQPKEIDLNIPNSKLMTDQDYINCYKAKAYKIKKTKNWINYGIGSGIFTIIIFSLPGVTG